MRARACASLAFIRWMLIRCSSCLQGNRAAGGVRARSAERGICMRWHLHPWGRGVCVWWVCMNADTLPVHLRVCFLACFCFAFYSIFFSSIRRSSLYDGRLYNVVRTFPCVIHWVTRYFNIIIMRSDYTVTRHSLGSRVSSSITSITLSMWGKNNSKSSESWAKPTSLWSLCKKVY